MKIDEWLLLQLMSEASEVAHAASKMAQFGINDEYPGYGNNTERLILEINDLFGAIEELQSRKILPLDLRREGSVDAKRNKIRQMIAYARARGVIED